MNKIEKIKAEIERRIALAEKCADAACEKNLHSVLEANEMLIRQYESLLCLINSRPEEIPPCQTGFKADPVGRRGRQGMVPRWISEKAEEYQRQMEPPYDSDDIISAYESGAMWNDKRFVYGPKGHPDPAGVSDLEEDALLLERAWLTLDGFGHEELAERLRQFAERKGLIWK